MFKRMLSVFGIGGPSVDTVLDSPHAVPGLVLTGQVHVQGGSADAEIGQVVLSLVARTGTEHGGTGEALELQRLVVQRDVWVAAGRLVSIPFQLRLPWETPITAVGGTALPGISVDVRTELVIAGAPDKGDLDPVLVHPLPSQDKVLDAFGRLGFTFRGTDVETGRLPGVPHELDWHQELAFFPPARLAGEVYQVGLTFVAKPEELHVVLQAGERHSTFSPAGDIGHLRLSHEEAQVTDWAAAISGWLAQIAERRPGSHHHDDHEGGRRGPGMGGMLAAGAAGVAGGLVLGQVADEFLGDDED
ncbi:sporulation protein [Lentzea kentuckyensis]|uniref:sporulation protein n=1 Tax=Lentzea kentuckyensis TaxID=360086 RepID=UPI000A3CB05B|nr:sporulation protein [Lentzea kentuckyensis]